MLIAGVDPGLAHTGWALVSRDRDVVACGCIRTAKRRDEVGDEQRRLTEVTAALLLVIPRATVVVIEWPSSGGFARGDDVGNVLSACQTGKVAALAFGLAAAHGRPTMLPAPVTWRSVLGSERGRDEELHANLLDRYRSAMPNVRPGDYPHVLDAIGLALYRLELADRAEERASRQLALTTDEG